jgi:hypothetical protein
MVAYRAESVSPAFLMHRSHGRVSNRCWGSRTDQLPRSSSSDIPIITCLAVRVLPAPPRSPALNAGVAPSTCAIPIRRSMALLGKLTVDTSGTLGTGWPRPPPVQSGQPPRSCNHDRLWLRLHRARCGGDEGASSGLPNRAAWYLICSDFPVTAMDRLRHLQNPWHCLLLPDTGRALTGFQLCIRIIPSEQSRAASPPAATNDRQPACPFPHVARKNHAPSKYDHELPFRRAARRLLRSPPRSRPRTPRSRG